MRFLVDENLSSQVVEGLREEAGHDAVHVRDIGLASSDDVAVLAAAHQDARVLVSADTDFGGLLARTRAVVSSVILIRRLQQRRAIDQADLLLGHLPDVAEELAAGSVVVFDEDRLRIRRLPI